MVKWNEKEIVGGIASKYNKIVCYIEKYKSIKKNILHAHKGRKMCFAFSVYSLPNLNVRVVPHGFTIDTNYRT